MTQPGYRILVLDFFVATLCGWVVYLCCKYGLSYTQRFLGIALLNELDKVGMATCAAVAATIMMLRMRQRAGSA